MRIITCAGCAAVVGRHKAGETLCQQCANVLTDESRRCTRLIRAAVSVGAMKPARAFDCVDCGADAKAYDHRDYEQPFNVQPVCHRCNYRRGHAIWHSHYLERSRPELAASRVTALETAQQGV